MNQNENHTGMYTNRDDIEASASAAVKLLIQTCHHTERGSVYILQRIYPAQSAPTAKHID